MAKYQVGQILQDIKDGTVFTILMISPAVDYENQQTYFCQTEEVIENKIEKYFHVWDEEYLDKWTTLIR